jgi:two-component system nitrogen regulation sensor histidine kinase NtrY
MTDASGFKIPPRQNGSRNRRYILAGIVFLVIALAGTHIFLNRTSVGSPRFIGMTFSLYTGTVVVVLALLILATILGRNLIKLYFEKKSGQLGSGFKTKMVSTFIVLSLLPAVLLFLLAYSLISSSIEQWFRAPPVQMTENSRLLAQQYYSEAEQRAKYFAADIAEHIQSRRALNFAMRPQLREQLQDLCRQFAIGNVRVFDRRARLIADTGNSVSSNSHRDTIEELIARAINGQQDFRVERAAPDDALTEISWATAPIRDTDGSIIGAILTETVNPQSARFRADAVTEAYDKYEELQQEKAALRFNTLLILLLSTLLIVFAFSWFALYLAKRITVPIQALAQGAAAVAAGNLGHRVECQALDELGSLVASFNQMTSDLQENEMRIEAAQLSLHQKNFELDDRRRYIETILQTISTGVISLDSGYNIRTMNRAALRMLQVAGVGDNVGLEEVVHPPAYDAMRVLLNRSTVLGTVMRNIEFVFPGKSLQLATTVSPLVDSDGQHTGWVVVLEDMTELLRMEKMSAWQEVARRMAHEIKNPLTPIQLSAERLLRRYKRMSPSSRTETAAAWQEELSRFGNVLEECSQTIIQEANSLKNLVDEFSRFARLPEVKLEEADLNDILNNTLSLYNGRIHDISIHKDFDSNIPKLRLDPEQMKRVFINLFDNALEAMAENPNEKVLQLSTHRNTKEGSVSVEIGDSGRGFPEEYQDSLFLPYFSTRKGGTGLGLAIVRQIVSDHHGTIRAEPNSPAGTRIIIDLPLALA